MSRTPESSLVDLRQTVADLQRANAELQRRLEESNAERDEAAAQQTATAEVLGVINSSPGDLAPVFDAILEKALRLCEATQGHVWAYDGEWLTPLAVRGELVAEGWFQRVERIRPANDTPVGRVIHGAPLTHVADASKEPAYETNPVFREQVDAGHLRTILVVPLRNDDALFGTITVYRQEVRPFTDKQIALLQNFARN